ncbi:MAG: RdgB/HAM1 family non-canonical purine NTP pyrophosphatase [Anaerolineae bacterium]|nr:MAG: RdgB/HAM1 family non-canonical purine NTP pyrophosphatase [Anaerolineae bacterium]
MKLLVATTNRGKLAEYCELLADIDVEWVDLQDVGLGTMEVAETEDTFAANAILKARAYCEASGLLTLADDSGLVVDALEGAPGVYSARYGAPEVTTDRGRYEKLLAALQDVPLEKRTARFKCVVALAAPDQEIVTVEGKIEGRIAFSPRGSNGFGYDPVFLLSDGRTLAELPSAEKNRISHRGNALEKAQPLLIELIKKINI